MNSNPKRILIASVTVGAGHVQAAKAIEEAWRRCFPEDQVVRCDVLDFMPHLFRKAYSDGYIQLVKHAPELFGRFFTKTDSSRFVNKMIRPRRQFARFSARRFVEYVNRFSPDAVVCTHFLPLEIFGSMSKTKTWQKPLIATVVTDFEAHALWMEPCTDCVFVATEFTKARLVERGLHTDFIRVSGIPISHRFSGLPSKNELCEKVNLRKNIPTVLVLGGGFGVGPIVEIVSALQKLDSSIQLLVVTGKNERLYGKLKKQPHCHPTRVFGFVENMHELMGVSDIVLTKPGGLTSSEALALGKPLLILNPIPGQEAANSDFLLENGAAQKLNHIDDLPYKIKEMLRPHRLKLLSMNAKKLGRPEAGLEICRYVRSRIR